MHVATYVIIYSRGGVYDVTDRDVVPLGRTSPHNIYGLRGYLLPRETTAAVVRVRSQNIGNTKYQDIGYTFAENMAE